MASMVLVVLVRQHQPSTHSLVYGVLTASNLDFNFPLHDNEPHTASSLPSIVPRAANMAEFSGRHKLQPRGSIHKGSF